MTRAKRIEAKLKSEAYLLDVVDLADDLAWCIGEMKRLRRIETGVYQWMANTISDFGLRACALAHPPNPEDEEDEDTRQLSLDDELIAGAVACVFGRDRRT